MKGVWSRMFKAKTIADALQIKTCLSESMVESINLWNNMYRGTAPWCEDYVKSLRKEQGICREFSNVCLNEMELKVSNEKLDAIVKGALRELNEHFQDGLALGAMVIKPLGGDKVEYLAADRFIPIEFDARGRMTDVVFVQQKKIGEVFYNRLERHTYKNDTLTITNRAFRSTMEDTVGNEISLEAVEEWAGLPPSVTYTDMKGPDFGYYRNPISNSIDGSFCGVSVFDAAVNQLKNADIQGARLDWEFESGERAINVDIVALQQKPVMKNGKTVYETPKLNKRLYRGLNLQQGVSQDLYKEWSPEFRDESIINGLNAYLRQIEFNVSLAYGDISDAEIVEKTATELKIAKKRKYNMVTAIQENLKECLEDLVYALAFYNAMTQSGYEFTCGFKDSILTDEETERAQDRQDVAMGAMPLWQYRAKWYNEDEKTAKKMVTQETEVME
ncbi:MAG: phage capsid protein [Lachnospiraceae bacterium]